MMSIPVALRNRKVSKAASSKRRGNLFKKAAELSTLCGAGLAIFTISEMGKVSMFSNSATVIHRYLTRKGKGCLKSTSSCNGLVNLRKKRCAERSKKAVEGERKELGDNAAAEEGVGNMLIDLNLVPDVAN